MKKMELLAPAGDLEKLKIAIDYGADAVYFGGEAFGLRAGAGNFTKEEIREGAKYAHERGKKIYMTVNIFAHNEDIRLLPDFLRGIADLEIDAFLVSDPGVIAVFREILPDAVLHLSTQANTTNYMTAKFWYDMGISRIVAAREMSFEELREFRREIPEDMEIEAFVHGAMCISYSGRCVLSNYMSMRDANRGGCSQSCRWKYDLYDMPFAGERKSITGEVTEEFSMSAVDMSMIEHIPDMIENGVNSLKIEGRMKSIHYVSTVSNVYKAAIDAYLESPERFEEIKPALVDELWKVAQRELDTGFYYGTPDENKQLFGARRKIPEYKFVGEVVDFDAETMVATIRQRNVITEGDQIEFYGPGFRHVETMVKNLRLAETDEHIDRAPNPMTLLHIDVPFAVKAGDMIRKNGSGLINLYDKKTGLAKTVRA